MLYQQAPRLPGESALVGLSMGPGVEPEKYLEVLRQGLEVIQDDARAAMDKRRAKFEADQEAKKAGLPKYEEGQLVRLHVANPPKGTSSKWHLPWRSMFRVIELFNDGLNYRIQPLGGRGAMNVHVTRLAPAFRSRWLIEMKDRPGRFRTETVTDNARINAKYLSRGCNPWTANTPWCHFFCQLSIVAPRPWTGLYLPVMSTSLLMRLSSS
mmetsp:Transcript_17222/g.41364  ORF Transcript_17222/g.41364 Transcript_17222/m.41364 type:complete len:211 (+) Transcript_17222:1534-2166(+)